MPQFPEPGAFLFVDKPQVHRSAEGCPDSQEYNQREANAGYSEDPIFKSYKKDGSKEDKCAGKEEVVSFSASER